MSTRVNREFFEENFGAFKKILSKNVSGASKQGKIPNQDEIFKQAGATVRESAYKKLNNATSFPRNNMEELAARFGIRFDGHGWIG